MTVHFGGKSNLLRAKRKENKKRIDALRKTVSKNELKVVFNDFYRDQVSALYREVTGRK